MTDYLSFSSWINSAIDLNCEISKNLYGLGCMSTWEGVTDNE